MWWAAGGVLALVAVVWLFGRAQRARGRQQARADDAEDRAKSAQDQAGMVRPSDGDLLKRLRDNGF